VIHLDAGAMALLAAAGFLAAAWNAVAGGGSLVSFPALLFLGYPALTANVTNTVGLLPGYAGGSIGYRAELRGQGARIRLLGAVACVGAIAGAVLLTVTAPSLFRALAPWLILVSCALLAVGPIAGRVGQRRADAHANPALVIADFVAGAYGAFFGAGLGVMVLGFLSVFVSDGLQRLNALKGVLSLLINLVAALYFVAFGPVAWQPVFLMLPASLGGGLAGAALARILPAAMLRTVVILYSVAVAIRLLV
jgi:uncharacterized membrane protein YfcA